MARIRKKGFFFTVDALLATSILLGGIIILSSYYIADKPTVQLNYLSQDIINSLDTLKINELNNVYVDDLIADGNITDVNNSILEQIGEFWAFEKFTITQYFISNITEDILPSSIGFGLYVNQDEVYTQGSSGSSSSSARRMISGYERKRPFEGTSSRAYLATITNKPNSIYAYFGGFVGQGTLFQKLETLPSDATISSVTLEVDAADSFDISINDVLCGTLIPDLTENMTSESFDLIACNSSFVPGIRNNISIDFNGDVSDDYIAGGFLRVDYLTSEFVENYNYSQITYDFPGIDVVSNLYSSFYIPGTLDSMNVHLHFESEYPTYLTIGDRTVYQNNGSVIAEQTIDLNDINLTSFPVLMNYDSFNRSTVPIRFASYNNSQETVLQGGNADVVLITDLSGSMKLRMNSWSTPGNAIPNCKESDIVNPKSRRLGVAACLDSEFNAIVMNDSFTGNRLWLVDFATDANPFYTNNLEDLTRENIEDEIVSRYKSKSQNEIQGYTCLSCSINMAYDILEAYSDETRPKTVLVMTDGIPTHCSGGYFDGPDYVCNETSTGTTGDWPTSTPDCSGDLDACLDSDCDGPINNAINSAKRLNEELGVVVHAAGFGPIEDCYNAEYTLTQIADEGNGTFFIGSDASGLRDFYNSVAYNVTEGVIQTAQTITTKGNLTLSKIYSDSYIEIDYTPIVNEPEFGDIIFNFKSDNFDSCEDNIVEIPSKLEVLEAKVTSFSGPYWTKNVSVNDNKVFLLEDYNYNFERLGDPFIIYIPPELLVPGNNTISIKTGEEPVNDTGCSQNNSLIYKASIPGFTSYGDVLENAAGFDMTNVLVNLSADTTPTCTAVAGDATAGSLANGQKDLYTLTCTSLPASGQKFKSVVAMSYTNTGTTLNHSKVGELIVKIP